MINLDDAPNHQLFIMNCIGRRFEISMRNFNIALIPETHWPVQLPVRGTIVPSSNTTSAWRHYYGLVLSFPQ